MRVLEQIHWVGGIAPAADVFAGNPSTDEVEVLGEGFVALIWMGTNGGTDAPNVKVYACDDTASQNSEAVAFYYKASTSLDTWGDWTAATSDGFSVSGTSNNLYIIYAPAAEFASEGYGYAKLTFTESGSDGVYGMVLQGVVNPRYQEQPSSLLD